LDEDREVKTPIQPVQQQAQEPQDREPYLRSTEATEAVTSQDETDTFDFVGVEDTGDHSTEDDSGLHFQLIKKEEETDDTAPSIAPNPGNETPEITVYTLDSDPLPLTSDIPDLEGINFLEKSEPVKTPDAPITPPLSFTGISRDTDEPKPSAKPAYTAPADAAKTHVNRTQRIQQYTRKLKTPGGLADLEAEPAFKRRHVVLDDVDHSSTSKVSRFNLSETIDEEGESHIELRNDNPFLHDNVD
jgi:hypothetical protein